MNENDKPQPKEPTKSEALEREIATIEAELKRQEQIESMARNEQHWCKKRLKLAKDQLAELKEA
jgi:chromosome segregation ATPase